ncbi:AAA family ATPase [Saccharolobus islandicus]|uniref:ATPase n=1 Tax=Saccharolobus islandicus (strain L.D.8.5 / Lassen \|nr:ATP-binding protein [Sulfolobus islandicus]ADB86231.1 ATPase [Sulfolobus islandicus L.D.8.5]
MLFDLHPKQNREELFGRDYEIEYVINQILSGNWVIIGGQREIGKTSLMKVVINELRKKYGFKGIYVSLRGVRSLNSLLNLIILELNKSKTQINLRVSINFVVGSAGIELKRNAKAANSLIELFNSIQEEFVIGIDEVQEISKASRQFLDVLGNVFSTNPKVKFIFTGSYVGVTKTLINPSASSPLHGRPPALLNLKPFNEELSKGFLRKGMEELNVRFDKENEVVKKLDGIVGWLTLFGNFYAIRRMDFKEALNLTLEEGKKIMIEEFNHFLESKTNKQLYLIVMETLKFVNRWKDIKRGVEIKMGKVDDKELSLALDALINSNFVTKGERGEYTITDPILKEIDFEKLSSRNAFI